MRDPESLQIVLVRPDGGPPDMEGVEIPQSWAYLHLGDESVITWDELTSAIDKATTPADRWVHIEIDELDWGASGPLEVAYQVALEYGFEAALVALAAWVKSRFGAVNGVLSDTKYATRLALRHLKKYHNATEPDLESVDTSMEAIELVIRNGHQRFRVKVRGKEAMIIEAQLLDTG
ncbi:MAG TPA: hypothetical protein VJ935_10925 [Acidimicrobiia bacterium]|nr:hypothetical protein [Acidimicrobiia bacterium]